MLDVVKLYFIGNRAEDKFPFGWFPSLRIRAGARLSPE